MLHRRVGLLLLIGGQFCSLLVAHSCEEPLLKGAEAALADFYKDPLFFPPKSEPLKYLDLSSLAPDLARVLDPQKFLADMQDRGILEFASGDYARDCSSLCENAVAWALIKLRQHPEWYARTKVVAGSFYTRLFNLKMEHFWLQIKIGEQEYFVDLTLKQFLSDAPELAVVEARPHDTHYNVWVVMSPDEYIGGLQRDLERDF